MLGAWILYYLAWAAHLVVGGYALARGSAPAKFVIFVVFAALIFEQSLLAVRISPGHLSYLWLEVATNCLQCLGLLIITLRYRAANWLVVVLLIKAAELGLDGCILQPNPDLSHAILPQVSNALSLIMMGVLAWEMSRKLPRAANGGPNDFIRRARKTSEHC